VCYFGKPGEGDAKFSTKSDEMGGRSDNHAACLGEKEGAAGNQRTKKKKKKKKKKRKKKEKKPILVQGGASTQSKGV